MLVFKITLTILGDSFDAKIFVDGLCNKQLTVIAYNNVDDLIEGSVEKKYEFGSVILMHKPAFVSEENFAECEVEFVQFLETENDKLRSLGAQHCILYTEIYYFGTQCNFEILNKTLINRLNLLTIPFSLPISIYPVKKRELKTLLDN